MIIKTDEKKSNVSADQKVQSKKKQTKKKDNGLRKDYKDMQPCRVQTLEFPISKMTYGFIQSHDLKYIVTTEGRIDFRDSWIEFILYMMYSLIKAYPDTYKDLFRRNNVTTSALLLDKTYGTVKLDGKEQYRVFKLYDTDLYVESRFEAPEVFEAVAGLIKIYSGEYNTVFLGIEDKTLKKNLIDFENLDSNEKAYSVDEVLPALEDGYIITEIEIHNERLKITELDGVLYIFCKWVYDNFSDTGIKKLPKNKYVGVTLSINREDVDYNNLIKTSYYIYTNHDNRDIINFIRKSIEVLKLDKNTIMLKVHKMINK